MRAVIVNQAGDPSVLTVGEWEKPVAGSGQLLVQVKAAGVNPIDTKLRVAPERFPVKLPFIPGCDAAGIVISVGDGVSRFSVGDEVYFSQPGFAAWQGTYAEYVAVDAALVAHKPKTLSFSQAAAAPLVLITAWEALHDRARIQPGQRVLIQAGAGGVGHVAIQLAKLAGAHVVTTVSNDEKAAVAHKLGAEKVINYTTQDVVAEVLAWSAGEGVDIVLDTVAGDALQKCFACVKPYGDVVTILQPGAEFNWAEARKRNLRFSFELMLSPVMMEWSDAKKRQGEILARCSELFDGNQLKIILSRSFPLNDVTLAHQCIEQEHPIGKLIIYI